MAEYSLTIPTAVAVGEAVPFNNVIRKGCCNIRHRAGSGIITVKGGTCCHPNLYRVYFHATVTGVAGTIQLGIFLDGELLPETLMSVVPAAATGVWSVDAMTEIYSEGANDTISVRVVEGDTVTVNSASIIVDKEVA